MTDNTEINKYIYRIEDMLTQSYWGEDALSLLNNPEWRAMRIFLIGGAVRDAIEGEIPRDMDFVIAEDTDEKLKQILEKQKIHYRKNVFNGYKLEFEKTTFDVWLMKEHYLVKGNVYSQNVRNLKNTTFLNYDSLIYDMRNNRLNITYYEQCIQNCMIDFVGNKDVIKKNPSPILSIIKVMMLKAKKEYNESERVEDYIANQYEEFGEGLWVKIWNEYERHYNERISRELSEYIKYNILVMTKKSFERQKKNSIEGQKSVFDYFLADCGEAIV